MDLAVHSLKDLPTELPTICAGCDRRAPIHGTRWYLQNMQHSLASLPDARVGTSSQRRAGTLRALRPDCEVLLTFRGNVDTRLRKLGEGRVRAIICWRPRLDRLGRDRDGCGSGFLRIEHVLPGGGAGALGHRSASGGLAHARMLGFLDDADSRLR